MLHDMFMYFLWQLWFDHFKGALIMVLLLDSFASGCLRLFTVHVVLLYSLVVMFHLFVAMYEAHVIISCLFPLALYLFVLNIT